MMKRWPEDLGASHTRAMWIKEFMADHLHQMRKAYPEKNMAILLVSHGMMVEQMGNLYEQHLDSSNDHRMLTMENIRSITR